MSLDDLSADLQSSLQNRLQSDAALQASNEKRFQLPVAYKRQEILDTINDSPVVIIRGNTGCGKTTQVCQYIL
ncbi:UNVERIFIED_CONTAM: hypothetical protein GTU68_032878, partial [Idotea baltica]|nr:hypothetical protein [Idotea baltica]